MLHSVAASPGCHQYLLWQLGPLPAVEVQLPNVCKVLLAVIATVDDELVPNNSSCMAAAEAWAGACSKQQPQPPQQPQPQQQQQEHEYGGEFSLAFQ